jgi:hypothetical protein
MLQDLLLHLHPLDAPHLKCSGIQSKKRIKQKEGSNERNERLEMKRRGNERNGRLETTVRRAEELE